MFHRQHRLYANLLLAADVLAGLWGLYLAYYLRYYLVRFAPLEISSFFNPELLPFRDYLLYFLIAVPLWALLLMLTQRYSAVLRLPLGVQAFRVLQFLVATGFFMGFLTYSFKLLVSRPVFFAFWVFVGLILLFNRVILHWLLRTGNINEHSQIKILIAGTDDRARRVGQLVESYKMWGYHIVGYLSSEEGQEPPQDLEVIGSLKELPSLLHEHVVDEIIFLGSQRGNLEEFEGLVELCQDLGIRIRVATDFLLNITSEVSLEYLENLPMLTFSTVPEDTIGILAKRVVDVLVALVLLVVFSPFTLITGAFIKLTSSGPMFYRQVRCGLYGRKFELVKFRTMIDGAEDKLWEIKHLNEMGGPVFKMRNDPRVTRLGRVLRKFSIDEIPQAWNVLKGEMSIVGPRAPLLEEVQHYTTKQRRRLSVKPGITCLWQVSGRNDIDFSRWMELDLEYIDTWSFWLDIRIMLRTIPAVFSARGAR
jgi:exopolysaccharide biosynthesis polyprenyl glycosylphosphotransferase